MISSTFSSNKIDQKPEVQILAIGQAVAQLSLFALDPSYSIFIYESTASSAAACANTLTCTCARDETTRRRKRTQKINTFLEGPEIAKYGKLLCPS